MVENLVLNLVYNPVGAFLPPAQEAIEADFKRELKTRYGIVFNNLFTITNMPIARYLDWLRRSKNEESYMQKLVNAFNPATIDGLMCRNLISVDWTGRLYDCDFNQMLNLSVNDCVPQTIAEFDSGKLAKRQIATGAHCFGCTAGAGSSCGGVVVGN
jgi:radical SAM/Cys-rich protein